MKANLFRALLFGSSKNERKNRTHEIRQLRIESLESRQLLAADPYVVTTVADVVDDSDGVVSLREAITSANNSSSTETITFNLADGEGDTIVLNSELTINRNVKIDGTIAKDTESADDAGNGKIKIQGEISISAGSQSSGGGSGSSSRTNTRQVWISNVCFDGGSQAYDHVISVGSYSKIQALNVVVRNYDFTSDSSSAPAAAFKAASGASNIEYDLTGLLAYNNTLSSDGAGIVNGGSYSSNSSNRTYNGVNVKMVNCTITATTIADGVDAAALYQGSSGRSYFRLYNTIVYNNSRDVYVSDATTSRDQGRPGPGGQSSTVYRHNFYSLSSLVGNKEATGSNVSSTNDVVLSDGDKVFEEGFIYKLAADSSLSDYGCTMCFINAILEFDGLVSYNFASDTTSTSSGYSTDVATEYYNNALDVEGNARFDGTTTWDYNVHNSGAVPEWCAGFSAIDLGAAELSEVSGSLVVTVGDYSDNPYDNLNSIREAVAYAKKLTAQGVENPTVTFSPDVDFPGTISANSVLAISLATGTSITIDGTISTFDEEGNKIDGVTANVELAVTIQLENGGLNLKNVNFNGLNDAQYDGAIVASQDTSKPTYVTIENSVIRNYKTTSASVVEAGYSTQLVNTLLCDNELGANNTGVISASSITNSLKLYNCTVAGNTSSSAPTATGGIYYNGASNGLKLYNTIIVNNAFDSSETASNIYFASSNTTSDAYRCVIGANAGSNYTLNLNDSSVLFNDFQDTIFTDATYSVHELSVAFNAGNNDYVTTENGYDGYDAKGNVRVQNDSVEIGAIETASVALGVPQIIVTIETDDVDSTDNWNDDGTPNKISFREAYEYVGKVFNVDAARSTVGTIATKYAAGFSDSEIESSAYALAKEAYTNGTSVDLTTLDEYDSNRVYTFSSSVPYSVVTFADGISTVALNSQLDVAKDFAIDGTTINGVVVISGESANRILNLGNGTEVYLSNVSFQNGVWQEGGAVYVASNATLNAFAVDLGANSATKGGAIYNAGSVNLKSSTLQGNTAFNHAGAIYNAGVLNVYAHNTITGNSATNGGGAIYNIGTANIVGESTFSLNTARMGGAIYASKGSATVTQATFSKNTANADAGATLNYGAGGAIYVASKGTATVSDATFTSNTAGKYGGAISTFGGLTVSNSLFVLNNAKAGGAIQAAPNSDGLTLSGNNFTTNSATKSATPLVASGTTSYGADNGGNGGALFLSKVQGDYSGSSSFTIDGNAFSSNTAENAGGAIDFISGVLTFSGNNTFTDNKGTATDDSKTYGGAIVISSKTNFADDVDFEFSGNTASVAPNVGLTNELTDAQKSAVKNSKLGDYVNDFNRWVEIESDGQVSISDLRAIEGLENASTFTIYDVDGKVKATLDDSTASISYADLGVLKPGQSYTISFTADGSSTVYKLNVYIVEATDIALDVHVSDLVAGSSVVAVQYKFSVPSTGSAVASWTLDFGNGTKYTSSSVAGWSSSYTWTVSDMTLSDGDDATLTFRLDGETTDHVLKNFYKTETSATSNNAEDLELYETSTLDAVFAATDLFDGLF